MQPVLPLVTSAALARLAATLTILLARVAIAGWEFDLPALASVIANTAVTREACNVFRGRMSPYRTAAFFDVGLALLALRHDRLKRAAKMAAALVILVGMLFMVGYLWNAGEADAGAGEFVGAMQPLKSTEQLFDVRHAETDAVVPHRILMFAVDLATAIWITGCCVLLLYLTAFCDQVDPHLAQQVAIYRAPGARPPDIGRPHGIDAEHMAIVSAILNLARALRIYVVAEGVETDEQAARLAVLGCDEAQGYLFSWPMPAIEIASSWLRRNAPNRGLQLTGWETAASLACWFT